MSATRQLRLLIIGAGARGNAYARAVTDCTDAVVYAVADPVQQKRDTLGKKYIWGDHLPRTGQTFDDWKEFRAYETRRREKKRMNEDVDPGVDGVFICTLDDMHAEIIIGLAPLDLHLMSEKPLATTLQDCLSIYRSLQPRHGEFSPSSIFSIGHVLHYSPHNMLLRKLLVEDCIIGDILSIEHTEPVGWWHFSHSYVRAKKIYHEKFLASGNAGWPVHIVDPEIEDLLKHEGMELAAGRLRARLVEDYNQGTPQAEVESRPWFGRCVYESDNDVCDDQTVTISWDDDPLPHDKHTSMTERLKGRGAKTATFHMIAQTEKQCERRGRVYGSKGEIEYDSKMIRVYDFATSKAQVHSPHQPGGGHGGGDEGLTREFILAMEAMERNRSQREDAQRDHIGCTLEDIIRSHAMVFAAEEARRDRKVIDWGAWWQENVVSAMQDTQSSKENTA
ncbi:MAG: hypothetical protein Q9178_001464 [Gyalolechia marmorata]